MEYSERLALNSLAILDALAADDDIIGSPFADPNGNGMTKYFNIVMSKNKANNKPSWWKILAER